MPLTTLVLLATLLVLYSNVQATANSNNADFTHIIIGGGTAGLVLANRLSSNPCIRVAVIEYGASVLNNPNVTNVTAFGLGLPTPINWAYTTAPQQYGGNRTLDFAAGKALGGTSTINGMTYLRAEKAQIDAWEKLGNVGWNWEELFPYYQKSEQFQTPDATRIAKGATFDAAAHGFHGPVNVGWTSYLMGENVSRILAETSRNADYPINEDANDGSMAGFTTWPMTADASKDIRTDAARAYYWSGAYKRPNLVVFTNTLAKRILFQSRRKKNKAYATGVEVVTADNQTKIISASAEVIVSAGSIRSPALLEMSGVGNPA
jgi:choline dehydrogenase-like flavoprotein